MVTDITTLRAQIEAGKATARARIDQDFGPGTSARMQAFSASAENRRNLAAICAASRTDK